jgi:hypothetical protein
VNWLLPPSVIQGPMGGKKPEDVERYICPRRFAITRTPRPECTPQSLIE